MKSFWLVISFVGLAGCQTPHATRNISNDDDASFSLSYIDTGDKLTFTKDILLSNTSTLPVTVTMCDGTLKFGEGEIYCKLEADLPPRTRISINKMDTIVYSKMQNTPRRKFRSSSGKTYTLFCRNKIQGTMPPRDVHESLQILMINAAMKDCFNLSREIPEMKVEPVNYESAPSSGSNSPSDI